MSKFKKFWNNNKVSDAEWETWNKYRKEHPNSCPLPPIGFRDHVLSFIVAVIFVIMLILVL